MNTNRDIKSSDFLAFFAWLQRCPYSVHPAALLIARLGLRNRFMVSSSPGEHDKNVFSFQHWKNADS
ncbi:MAG: hypothetical protein KTR32_18325 [Granulosicoccus sp.]|nr:hypothetical protein [Granulosicoccus sp.]